MAKFLRRFIGALALDASIYEDIEADRTAALHSMLVVAMAVAGGGVGVVGLGLSGVTGFLVGMVVMLAGWLVWTRFAAAVGTIALAEPQTRSSPSEVMRTVSFAMAPGALLVFAALKPAAPFVVAIVFLWIVAGSVLAMRQALDYRSTSRAIAVCVLSWLIAAGLVAAVAAMLTQRVS